MVSQPSLLNGVLRGQGLEEWEARLGPGRRGPRIPQAKWRVGRRLGYMSAEFCMGGDVNRAVL